MYTNIQIQTQAMAYAGRCTERLLSNNRTVKCLLLDANPMVPGERGCFAMPRFVPMARQPWKKNPG